MLIYSAGGAEAGNPHDPYRVPPTMAEAIAAEGGRVPFARFMEMALLFPEVGYYAAGRRPAGRHGDFVTVPARCPFFNRALSLLLADLVDAVLAARSEKKRAAHEGHVCDLAHVVEVGGGRGDMAAGVLSAWREARPDLARQVVWHMVEPSGPLLAAQRERLGPFAALGWNVRWASSLSGLLLERVAGRVVVTNELIDALPVHLIDVRGDVPRQGWMQLDESACRLREVLAEVTDAAWVELRFLFGSDCCSVLRERSEDGFIELRPAVRDFLGSAVGEHDPACVVSIDYGGWLSGSYEGRPQGVFRRTVRGYLRHEPQRDPLRYVGRQDLTADVDFGALIAHGSALGLRPVLVTDVACLLSAADAAGEIRRLRSGAETNADPLECDRLAGELERLSDPGDAGGLFEVVVQARDY